MKKNILAVFFVAAFTLSARADFLMQSNDVLGICGDSITEQHLYSAFMEEYLLMCQPTEGQKIIQFGWSGERAPYFLDRLHTDILPFKPTVITTCYGMNDGGYGPLTDAVADRYRQAQTGSVEEFKKNGVRVIVLGSAKCVDSYTYHKDPAAAVIYNQTLKSLADMDKEIATKEGVVYADVFGITSDVMAKAKAKFGKEYVFAGGDGVHPGENGHLVMAYAFLKALGCDGNIGTITVDLATGKATGTPGQEIVSCKDGAVDVKSTRYPFCFDGQPDARPGTAGIVTVFPFNDDLNRYTLVVKGLTTGKAKVTWGTVTKEYAAADLAKGVNLAADFLANPFVKQFNEVAKAVQLQEAQETLLSKTIMHGAADWGKNLAPGSSALLDQLIAGGMAQHEKLYQNAVDLVIPIEHTIKIEPEQ